MRPSYWSGGGEWRSEPADLIIVGAGFAGLSTAWHCLKAAPGLRVLILDRHGAGSGASGRNAGMVIPFPLFAGWLLDGRPAQADVAWAQAEWRARLARLVAQEDGRLLGARASDVVIGGSGWIWRSGLAWVGRRAEAMGVAIDRLGAAELWDSYGATASFGLRLDGWSIQPWRTAQNLRAAITMLGGAFAEGVEATGVAPASGQGVRIDTTEGPIEAGQVVVATNAYAGSMGGVEYPGPVIHSYMLATEPLAEDILARLGGERALVSQLGEGMAYRRVEDGRLLFGGLDLAGKRPTERVAQSRRQRALLLALLKKRLPWLPEVRIEREWGGAFVGREGPPLLGPSRRVPGLFYNTGYGGAGVALTLVSGSLMVGHLLPDLDAPESRRLRQILAETRTELTGLVRAGWQLATGT